MAKQPGYQRSTNSGEGELKADYFSFWGALIVYRIGIVSGSSVLMRLF